MQFGKLSGRIEVACDGTTTRPLLQPGVVKRHFQERLSLETSRSGQRLFKEPGANGYIHQT